MPLDSSVLKYAKFNLSSRFPNMDFDFTVDVTRKAYLSQDMESSYFIVKDVDTDENVLIYMSHFGDTDGLKIDMNRAVEKIEEMDFSLFIPYPIIRIFNDF